MNFPSLNKQIDTSELAEIDERNEQFNSKLNNLVDKIKQSRESQPQSKHSVTVVKGELTDQVKVSTQNEVKLITLKSPRSSIQHSPLKRHAKGRFMDH